MSPPTDNASRAAGETLALAMDLGGNWLRVSLATRGGDLLWKERVPTNAEEGAAAVIARVEELLRRGTSQAGDRKLAGIGIGVASPVDPETGTMYNPPNLPELDGVSFKSLWRKVVDPPVLVGNDATLAALGEYRYGAGVGAHTLVYMTISTGIGGGAVVQGRPLTGAHGMAAELGHMTIDRNGPRCTCGNVGCLESIASGTAIANKARGLVGGAVGSIMGDMVSGDLDRISAETVFEAASRGDPLARDVLDDAARGLGAGMVNVLHTFNPDVIVVGGGVSRNWDSLSPAVGAYIEAHAMSHIRKRGFKLLVSPLGDDIGLLGAAALVWGAVGEAFGEQG